VCVEAGLRERPRWLPGHYLSRLAKEPEGERERAWVAVHACVPRGSNAKLIDTELRYFLFFFWSMSTELVNVKPKICWHQVVSVLIHLFQIEK
jgi:hypothetical protein